MGTISAGGIQISGKCAMLKSGFDSVWIGLLLIKLCQKGFRTVNNLIYHLKMKTRRHDFLCAK